MFCHKCGNKVIDNAAYCSKCGAKLEQMSIAKENDELADMIDELQINILSGNTPIRNVGWLLSSRCTTISCDTYSCVVKSLNVANNPNLAFIAVGIDNVQDFVDEVYSLAQNVLITGIL